MGILFTFSRSAWLSLALALVLLCVLRRAAAIRIALAALIGGASLFVLTGSGFLGFFEGMAIRPEQGDSRFVLMRDALAEFARHPLLGGGLGNFIAKEGTIVHNTALWFLADFGLLGLSVLLGYLATFFAMAWYAYRLAPGRERPIVLALLLGHTAMFGLSLGIEALYQRHWWMIVSLIGAAYSLARHPAGSGAAARFRPVGNRL
jgi:O-antigen ligase